MLMCLGLLMLVKCYILITVLDCVCMHVYVKYIFCCFVSYLFVRKLTKDIINVSFEAEVCMYIYTYYHIHTYKSCVSFDCT